MTARDRLLMSLWIAGVTASFACDAGSQAQCAVATDCGAHAACVMGTCLPEGNARTVAIEISPRTDSTSAHTGLPAVNLGVDPIAADDRVSAIGVMIDNLRSYSANEHLVAVTPSPIPGQDDWRLETDVTAYHFMLGFGSSMLGAPATIWATAVATDLQTPAQPPISFPAIFGDTLELDFPTNSSLIPVLGKLHDSLDVGAPGFAVRATDSAGNVVSTTATTDADGIFKLLIAPGTVPSDLMGTIIIRADGPLGPDGMSTVPRFVSQPLLFGSVAGTANQPMLFRMPAFADRAPLRFTVQSTDDEMVPGVTVLFRAQIPAMTSGAYAVYEQQAVSDANGQVEAMLIPGTANAPLSYQLSLTPTPDSTYGSACVPSLPITMGGSGSQPQYSATLLLDYRVRLLGVVTGSDGLVAPGITATATLVATDSLCPNAPTSAPVSATTGRDGRYLMLLDPGMYKLDLDPPLGAPLPRLTEMVAVPIDLTHDVSLPAGEVINATLTAADNITPVASAGIKIFDVACAGATCTGSSKIAPVLRAQSQSDSMGRFSIVLPTPTSP